MKLVKQDLLKTLRNLTLFDSAASPYVALELSDTIRFMRSSSVGIIHNLGFGESPPIYVSLKHLVGCTKNLPEDEIFFSTNGGLSVSSIHEIYGVSESHVHTVHKDQAGLKHHLTGNAQCELDKEVFQSIDFRPFKTVTSPILQQGKLVLPMQHGIVVWQGPESLVKYELSPREIFLKATSNGAQERIFITEYGYWGAVSEGLTTTIKGYVANASLYEPYMNQGKELTRFPALRLLQALGSAVSQTEDTGAINVDAKQGVSVKNRFGGNHKFSLGNLGNWPKFSVQKKTAKTILDALSQAGDGHEEISLQMMSNGMRVSRGDFSVAFRPIL
jgi:hypothetical protein